MTPGTPSPTGGDTPGADMLGGLDAGGLQEKAWVEVVRKMDEVYSDLIRYEVDLETQNARLEEAQAFIGSVLAAMSDVLIVCGLDGRVQQVNRAVLDLTGRPEAELIGRPLEDLLADGDASALAEFSRRPSGAVLRECEVRLRTAEGAASDVVAMNCSLRSDHRGRPEGSVLIGRPVGELRRAYADLERAHRDLKEAQRQLVQQEKMASLGRLVAGVAHELNNPISFVNGNVHILEKYCHRIQAYVEAVHGGVSGAELEVLRKSLRIDRILEDVPDLIEGTLEGAERVTDIVTSLRRLSFAQAGPPEVFDLADVARTAVQWTVKGGAVGTAVSLDLASGLLVRGQEGQIHQVLTNLIQNALDAVAGQPGGTIAVQAGHTGEGGVRLTVADNGPGIAPDHLTTVFDPFFTTKPVGQGTGLGLWISYGLVRDHDGTLSAGNRPEGGAVFTIELPAA